MTESSQTGTSESEAGGYGRSADVCSRCGARLDLEDWHPVVTCPDADGDLQLLTFCDDECRRAWESRE